jgi:hypothetical protein
MDSGKLPGLLIFAVMFVLSRLTGKIDIPRNGVHDSFRLAIRIDIGDKPPSKKKTQGRTEPEPSV